MIKKNGIDIDDIGIMSVFFIDEKIVSMSLDIVDDKVSTAMLANAPSKYAAPLYKLIDSINKNVIEKLQHVDESTATMTAIRNYTSNYNG